MLKRLPFLCASLLALAACSHDGGESASAPPAAPASAPAPAAPTTATAPAATGTVASASTAASAPTPAPAAAPSQPFVDDGKWVEGKNYFLIEPVQPKVENTDKIEVVEAFSYGCPACFQAHTLVDKLAASLPANAQLDYLPVSFRPDENWPVYQQAFYAAQALGIDRKTHDALFDATWKTGETATYDLAAGKPKSQANWPTIETFAKFYSKYGVSAADFVATANSFSVKMKMKRADDLQKSYGVDGTPTLVIDGKYRFDGRSAGSYPQMIELAQYLVAKEAAGK